MSRSGYIDGDDDWERIKWRGQVASAIRGKRGQKLLTELVAAMEAMPEKLLIADELQDAEGSVCALGAVGKLRGIDMTKIDPEEPEDVASAFDIARQLAQEIVYVNDEWGGYGETCEARYERVLNWAKANLRSGIDRLSGILELLP